MKHDVVYILKSDVPPDELRYSLRTVEKNFPYRGVWFYCGCPGGIVPDRYVPMKQKGTNKWELATSSIREICNTADVSEDFWLFNDDFFVLRKIKDLPYMYRGLLSDRVAGLRSKYRVSGYANMMRDTEVLLERNGLGTLDYALHIPMLINKRKAIEVLDQFPRCPMFRSLYGNYWEVGGIQAKDVKVYDLERVPDRAQTFASTTEETFKKGNIGKHIRQMFNEPSKWENNNAESL